MDEFFQTLMFPLRYFITSLYCFYNSCTRGHDDKIRLTYDGNGKYEINTVIKGRHYAFWLNTRRGPPQVRAIYDENANNVTSKILPYLGPNENGIDFDIAPVSPSTFHLRLLTVELFNGGTVHFYDRDIISLNGKRKKP